jgi:SAM-dependent methyltransferase
MLQRIARSFMYRAFGLLCHDARTEKAVPKEVITAPPNMRVIDPDLLGVFDRTIERVVPLDAPSAFSLDDLPRTANGSLPSDRYDLALSMLPQGSGICLDACTSDPKESVRSRVEELGYTYLPIDVLRAKRVQQEDLTKLSFSDDSIGGIISCDTIEHISAYETAAKEMHRVLRPGAVAVLHFPVYYFDRPTGIPIIPGADPWDHVRYFSAREMLELFHRTGFGVLRAHMNFDYGALLAVLAKPAT